MVSISSHLQIRQRAYEIFQARQQTGRKGDALSDWLEAEQEIRRSRISIPASTLDLHPTTTFSVDLARIQTRPASNPSASRIRSTVGRRVDPLLRNAGRPDDKCCPVRLRAAAPDSGVPKGLI
jgi:hypothetical protein